MQKCWEFSLEGVGGFRICHSCQCWITIKARRCFAPLSPTLSDVDEHGKQIWKTIEGGLSAAPACNHPHILEVSELNCTLRCEPDVGGVVVLLGG